MNAQKRLRVLDGVRRTIGQWDHGFGLEWPADDVLIAIGSHAVRFLRPETGEIVADHPFHHAPAARRPLVFAGRDLGDQLRLNPTFALDEDSWAVAFEDGTVIAEPGRDDDLAELAELDDRLCWSIARRFAWPFRWGDQKIFPDPAHAGVGAASPETERLLAPFRGRGSTAEATGTWPPPDTATVTDLITVVRGTLVDLTVQDSVVHAEWTVDTLQQLAMVCARRGETAEARELALAMPEHRRRLGHLARIALTLGAAGFDAEAAAVFPYAGSDPADVSDAADLAAVAGACAVLGRHERSEQWFAFAREAADADRSNWEVRLPLVWALTECGREQEARVVLDEGQGTPRDRHHGVPWLVCLLRRGETELVRELIGERSERNDPDKSHAYGVRWFDDWTAARALTVYGQPDLLRLWGHINRAWVRDDLPVAERISSEGRPTGPTADQVIDLGAQHAALAKLPKATKRRESAHVARNAAECGHISAVLDLLPGTGDPGNYGLDSNTRTWVALSALRTIAIGVDVDVW